MKKINGTPLYYKIIEDIKHQIITGKYKTGDKLPSEMWLMDHYKVSRVTVRKALKMLVEDNYLLDKSRKGKFIASRFLDYADNSLICPHKYMLQHGIAPTSKILSMNIIKAPNGHCRAFQLSGRGSR